jgi:hypothetical protein
MLIEVLTVCRSLKAKELWEIFRNECDTRLRDLKFEELHKYPKIELIRAIIRLYNQILNLIVVPA